MYSVGKGLLCQRQTAKVQISICISAVWSGHSLFVDIYYIYPLILLVDNKYSDQPALMHRLIWACIVCILHKGSFHALWIPFRYILDKCCHSLEGLIPNRILHFFWIHHQEKLTVKFWKMVVVFIFRGEIRKIFSWYPILSRVMSGVSAFQRSYMRYCIGMYLKWTQNLLKLWH